MNAPAPSPDPLATAAAVDNLLLGFLEPEDEPLRTARRAILDAGMPEISISPLEGRLLQLLVRLSGAQQVLEIGTLGGVAAIWMARALPAGGRLLSLEIDPGHAEVARRSIARADLGDRIDVRVGRALDLLPSLEQTGDRFGFVFIDADKEPYAEYLDWSIRLARPGALIVADNVVRAGRILDPAADDRSALGVRRFNEALARDPRVEPAFVQTLGARGHDGMALARVR